MNHTTTLTSVAAASFALLVGCGDAKTYSLDPGTIDWETIEARAGFDGARVELARYSSECARTSVKSLSAEVGNWIEFVGDAVATLDAPCSVGPSPSVDVRVERSKLIFDFSPITEAGRFPSAEFNGFVMNVGLHEDNALLIGATIDRESSTLALDDDDIYFERDYIEVNFEGVSYDQDGVVDIKLWFANLDPLSLDAE